MKVLVFSDLHVHHYKQFNADLTRAQKAANMIDYVFKLADANNIDQIWFAGDMGDQFENMSVIAMNAMLLAFERCFREYPNIEFIAIPGNHDMATQNTPQKPGISAMDAFEIGPYGGLFKNFVLLNGGYYAHEKEFSIVGVPYFEDPDDFWTSLERSLTNDIPYRDNMFLLMHQMIWPENDFIRDDVNWEDPRFKQFKWVFNGHVHHPSMWSNFVNVGSPMHRDAGDVDGEKGLWLLYTDGEKLPAFWPTTDKNPQYIRRPYGHKLEDWEKEQYVVWFHPEDKKKKKKDTFDSSKFNTQKVQPVEILDNFLDANAEKLDYPKADLQGVATKYFE
jgi:DNA repair exonuclease SbcCD nuclease subunit